MALPKALFRALLRPLASIKRSSQPTVVLWPRVQPRAWGQFEYGGQGDGLRLLPLPNDLYGALKRTGISLPPSPVVDAGDLFRFTAEAFRAMASASTESDEDLSVDQRLDFGFVALKLMGEVAAAWAASSAGPEEHGVRVFCAARFLQHDPETGEDVFAYRLLVENRGQKSVQVLGRHWLFEGAGGQQVHVPRFADGLIGQKPQLEPGQWFAYGSGCSLPGGAPGFMRGALLVEAASQSSSSSSSSSSSEASPAAATAAEAKESNASPSSTPATWEVEVATLPLKTDEGPCQRLKDF